jgi:alpha-glucosidase
MTKSVAEGLMSIEPNKRFLLFSRASMIGMHRYSGIWTGDNSSWWEHILMAIRMMPTINMCGFLYSGCDTGGFSHNASSKMIIRWTQFSIFTPLLRNHSVMGSRYQEPYSFDEKTTETMRNIIELRYALIPYLYSEYMKAVLSSQVLFSNLIYEYEGDRERYIDDQILCGESLMITPIYENNSRGRYVYLPEDMVLWHATNYRDFNLQLLKKGDHYIFIELEQVPIFIRKNKLLVLGHSAETVEKLDNRILKFIGYISEQARYSFYDDDGFTYDYIEGNYSTIDVVIEKTENEILVSIENNNNNQVKQLEFDLVDDEGNHYYLNTECVTVCQLKCKRR